MKKSGFVWFLSLLLCISCSCSLPRTYSFTYINSAHLRTESQVKIRKIYVDSAFGDADAVAIQDALNQWRYALNGYYDFKTITIDVVHGSLEPLKEATSGRAWIFLKIDSQNPLVVFHDTSQMKSLAFVEKIGGSILYMVRDRVNNESVRGVMMHEIGHLLGATHRWDNNNLMDPSYYDSNSQCIDQETLEQVAKYQGIPAENMNYCIYVNDEKDRTIIFKYVN